MTIHLGFDNSLAAHRLALRTLNNLVKILFRKFLFHDVIQCEEIVAIYRLLCLFNFTSFREK